MDGAGGFDPAELGALGERLVERDLVRSGWRILGRRVRTPRGEVDLWALDASGAAVAVEVKTGRVEGPDPFDPLQRPGRRLDRRALQRRLESAAWLARSLRSGRGRPSERGRVDLVEVLVDPEGRVTVIHNCNMRTPVAVLPGRRGGRPGPRNG